MAEFFENKIPLPEGLTLLSGPEGLVLTDGTLTLRADFSEELPRLKQSNLERELLVKAARIKGKSSLSVLDATAGLGEDSLLLAAAGFHVTMYENDPVIAALLEDALRRAFLVPELKETASRMRLIKGDSIAAMNSIASASDSIDVIYLDPMFPARKKSALIKKKFQLLQQLERPCGDKAELLSAALAAHPRKIVIKRPLKGPYLAARKPDYTLSGKAIRYDCIVLAK